MAAIKKDVNAAETATEVKAAATAEEKKAPAKKAAAKKTAAKKPAAKTAEKKPAAKTAEKKTAAKKTAVSENVFLQYLGSEITSADLIAKAKKASGVKSPKTVNVYVKPEENKVYYVVDNNAGSFDLV
jgi:hypothetical protein